MRSGSTGVGYTFERLLGISENTIPLADFYNIEIKTHRKSSNSNICLFNYDPIGSYSYEIKHLYDLYGYKRDKQKSQNVLNVSVYSHIKKLLPCNYKFMLHVDYLNGKVILLIYDLQDNLVDSDAYWTFETLKKKVYEKIQYLAYVTAESKFINGVEYFHYNSIYFYKLKSFDTFIKLIDNCKICVSFKIGGKINIDYPWQIDNHGTSFSIKSQNLSLLYSFF